MARWRHPWPRGIEKATMKSHEGPGPGFPGGADRHHEEGEQLSRRRLLATICMAEVCLVLRLARLISVFVEMQPSHDGSCDFDQSLHFVLSTRAERFRARCGVNAMI